MCVCVVCVCMCVSQVQRAVTSSSTTCLRSSVTLRCCRCSCPLAMSSQRRCLLTVPPTRANASVRVTEGGERGRERGRADVSEKGKDEWGRDFVEHKILWDGMEERFNWNAFSFSPSCRICEFWQPSQRSGCHPGHEWLPDRHEKTESAAQEAQRC